MDLFKDHTWGYIAIDGDNIGRQLEHLIATATEDEVRSYADKVSERLRNLIAIVINKGGRIVFSTGDGLLAWVTTNTIQELIDKAIAEGNDVTFSMGSGSGMIQSMLALKMAKATGRNRYLDWEDLVKK